MDLFKLINELINYAISKELIKEADYVYISNRLIGIFNEKEFKKEKINPRNLNLILSDLVKEAFNRNIISSNDIVSIDNFKAKIMDELLPKPSEVITKFWENYKKSPKNATDYLYSFAINSNYVQQERNLQNESWFYQTKYGLLGLTINLAKPEKDPKLIALAKEQSLSYPKCQLCIENEGYQGHIGYDSKANMRIIPITLNNEKWRFQYSPYSYYNEHSIVLNEEHVPMMVNVDTFIKLFDFLDLFPHYFVGSNAGLPIVGGSILSHEHYQSGRYHFPIEDAKVEFIGNYKSVKVNRLIWPMSTIRAISSSRSDLIEYAQNVLKLWHNYQNEELNIINTQINTHNTITPILRKKENEYEIDLVLRNNYTNDEYPDGVFHIHPKYYNLKKENIGLIEAMGLGILPPRLKYEFQLIEDILKGSKDKVNDPRLIVHKDWINELRKNYDSSIDPKTFIRFEAVKRFEKILECAGTFKQDKQSIIYFTDFIKETLKIQ